MHHNYVSGGFKPAIESFSREFNNLDIINFMYEVVGNADFVVSNEIFFGNLQVQQI